MATETATDVVMPQMGVSVSEGTITKWLKQEGETSRPTSRCSRSRPTRSTPRCRARRRASCTQILVQEGETVDVGTKLAQIGGAAGARAAEPRPSPRRRAGASWPTPPSEAARAARPQRSQPRRAAGSRRPSAAAAERQHVRLAGRRADRRRARRRPEPGPRHRPRRPGDEEGHPRLHRAGPPAELRRQPEPAERPPAPAPSPPRTRAGARRSAGAPAAAAPARAAAAPRRPRPRAEPGEQLEPMTAMRRGIAEHMRRSLDTSAHVTSAIEVDMSTRRRASREAEEGVPGRATASTRPISRSSRARPSRRSRTTRT